RIRHQGRRWISLPGRRDAGDRVARQAVSGHPHPAGDSVTLLRSVAKLWELPMRPSCVMAVALAQALLVAAAEPQPVLPAFPGAEGGGMYTPGGRGGKG